MFSLMITFLISSAVAKTQEELLEALDLESSKVVLRVLHALRHNQKPKLSDELPPSTPHRMQKAHHVLEVLFFIFNEKIIKINTTRMQKLKEFQERFQGEELLTYRSFLQEWQENKEHKYGQRILSLESNFEESITSEIMSDFIRLEEPAPQTSPISSASTDVLPVQVAMPSTSTDMSRVEDAPSTSTVHDLLLQELDKKSAIIIFKSILNKNCIPFEEFNLKRKIDQDRYGKVVAYLLWVLHNKEEKVLHQKAALNPDYPRFGFYRDWYNSKLKKYKQSREAITAPAIP